DAALVIAEGKVAWTGPAARAPAADTVVDAAGRAVLPGFADSHAHLVFAGERSAEFAARMAGRPYRAGGILGTVEATRAASDLVCGPMLDACAPSARWVDVFCEDGAFGADEAAAVLAAGQAAGLDARVHANQLGPGPGVRVAAEAGAASADHCTFLTDGDVDA